MPPLPGEQSIFINSVPGNAIRPFTECRVLEERQMFQLKPKHQEAVFLIPDDYGIVPLEQVSSNILCYDTSNYSNPISSLVNYASEAFLELLP